MVVFYFYGTQNMNAVVGTYSVISYKALSVLVLVLLFVSVVSYFVY